MRKPNKQTEIKFSNAILDIELLLDMRKAKYKEMENICRKHGASYSLPTFLSRLGYVKKIENNYYIKGKEFDSQIVKNVVKFQSANQKVLRQKREEKLIDITTKCETGTIYLRDVLKNNPNFEYDKMTTTELLNELRKTEAYAELKKRSIEIVGKQTLIFE